VNHQHTVAIDTEHTPGPVLAWCDLVTPRGGGRHPARLWLVKQCPYCGRQHTHGAGPLYGGNPFHLLGERAAHCRCRSGEPSRAYQLRSTLLDLLTPSAREDAMQASSLTDDELAAMVAAVGAVTAAAHPDQTRPGVRGAGAGLPECRRGGDRRRR
jgi:hypothetical protein